MIKMGMKTVFVASPFRGDEDDNYAYLTRALKDCIGKNEAPFAPHYIYPDFLDDHVDDDRDKAIEMGISWLRKCDLLAVYCDHGVSEGMKNEIENAKLFGIQVEYRIIDVIY